MSLLDAIDPRVRDAVEEAIAVAAPTWPKPLSVSRTADRELILEYVAHPPGRPAQRVTVTVSVADERS